MWSNKASTDVPERNHSPKPDAAADLQAIGLGAQRNNSRGVAGGLRIVGEIEGREDLFIAGEVNGSVFLPECAIHVGPHADVKADMTARVIEIEGKVTGDVTASERIAIRSSSTVNGDVLSPQIQIDEGSKFKGSVQMRQPDLKSESSAHGQPGAADAARYRAANE